MKYDPVEIFKALSNPSRLEILKFVYESDVAGTYEGKLECCEKCSCMGDITERVHLAPSTISHHIKELVRAGLVNVEKDGKFVRLLPNPEALDTVSTFVDSVRSTAVRK